MIPLFVNKNFKLFSGIAIDIEFSLRYNMDKRLTKSKKMATLNDIVKKTGFSICTVSRVLNGHPKIRQMRSETVETILRAAEELHYTPSLAARALATGKSHTLGFIVGDIKDDVFGYLNVAFIEAARKVGCQVLTLVTEWDPRRELAGIEELKARQCDGIFFLANSLKQAPELRERLAAEHYPIVVYGFGADIAELGAVLIDYSTGFREMLEQVTMPNLKVVAFFNDNAGSRWTALAGECRRRRIGCEYIQCGANVDDTELEQLVDIIIARKDVLFVFGSSTYAMRAISRLYARGISWTENIGIVGTGKERWGEYFIPALSTITFDVEKMMAQVVEALVSYQQTEPVKLRFPTVFTPRSTTCGSNVFQPGGLQ